MNKIINVLISIITVHVLMYFCSGDSDIIPNLIAAFEIVIIMFFIYSKTNIIDNECLIKDSNFNLNEIKRNENARK